ncbi:Uncharacterised protein [Vibrio cholerae]|nr:Uncharacterised protein [Vibrio cholerae]
MAVRMLLGVRFASRKSRDTGVSTTKRETRPICKNPERMM